MLEGVVSHNKMFICLADNEKCPIPREQGGADDVQLRICDSGDGVCSLSCSNADKEEISAPLPRYMTCSKLGVYDTQHPFDHLILPACNRMYELTLYHTIPTLNDPEKEDF